MSARRAYPLSIQSHVLTAAFSVIAGVALALVLAIAALTFFDLRAGQVGNSEVQVTMLADVLASPLALSNRDEIRNTIRWWRSLEDLETVVVYGRNGEAVVEWRRPEAAAGRATPAGVRADGIVVGLDAAHVVRPISYRGERLGTLSVEYRFGTLYRQIMALTGVMLLIAVAALAAAWLALKRLAFRVVQPLAELGAIAGAVAGSQDYSRRAGEEGPREVMALAHSFNHMLDALQHKAQVLDQELQERARTEARLDHLAHYDPVTGLANRIQFHKELPRAAERAKRQGSNLAVVFLDLDDFKVVNDTLGHDVGDCLLRSVGERLAGALRRGDLVCRLGGDEFTVILEGIHSLRTAVDVVSKLIEVLAREHDINGHALHVGVSAGIALYPAQTEDLGDLLRFADIAMYQAKSAGKNDYCVYTSELMLRASDRLSIEGELRRGLERDEFFLVYQPQVDIASGRIEGLEALLRWQHPSRGVVAPGYFIDVAEKSGLIVPLGRQVIAIACRQWQAWVAQGIDPPRLAVNVSGRQLGEEDFADELVAAMTASGRQMPRLELEITESLLLSDTRVSKAMLHRLAAAGIEWSLDDFGTGYSSLTYLAKFPIKNIKIDRSFIARLPGDDNSEAIVKAIVAMARGLGMRVITEGVETREQVAYLADLGGIIAQGYFYHRPLPAADVGELLRCRSQTAPACGTALPILSSQPV